MGRKFSKSSLFLFELIFAILFFSVSSAVCVQLFTRANLIMEESVNISDAMIRVASVAESYKKNDGDLEALSFTGAEISEGSLFLYYDADWNPTSGDGAAFIITVAPLDGYYEGCAEAEIKAEDSTGNELFSLEVSKFIQ